MILAERRNRRSRCEPDAGCYPDSRLQDLYINVLEFLSLMEISAQYHGAEQKLRLMMDNATSELVRNGYYVSGLKRTVFSFLNDLLASSQIIQLENQAVIGHIHRFAIYDLVVMGVSTLGGIFAFRKADLK